MPFLTQNTIASTLGISLKLNLSQGDSIIPITIQRPLQKMKEILLELIKLKTFFAKIIKNINVNPRGSIRSGLLYKVHLKIMSTLS